MVILARPRAAATSLLAGMLLGGCAGFSRDGGMDAVAALTRERTGHAVARSGATPSPAAEARMRELLAAPLDADGAVEIALLNNRGLQASLAAVGVAEAELVQAGRLRNPSFTFSRLRGGGETEIARAVGIDIVGLLTLPLRTRIEQGRFDRATVEAAASAVALAARTRRAYFEAVAAAQSEQYMGQVRLAADAGAELAARMAAAGNWSKLDEAREQVFQAEASAGLTRARRRSVTAREKLVRLLGLPDAKFALPDRLPDLPAQASALPDAEAQAIARRLDIRLAAHDADTTARALGLERATGLVNVLELGVANKSQGGAARQDGYDIALELPLFDWGGARSAKAEALYMQSVHRAADVAMRARSEARMAWQGYRLAYDAAVDYRDRVLPLRRRISTETLLRYNGMLASVFELLADAREQIAGVDAAIAAQRDFWLAETDLQAALNGADAPADKDRD